MQTQADPLEAKPVIGKVFYHFELDQIGKGIEPLGTSTRGLLYGRTDKPLLIPILNLPQGHVHNT